MNQRFAFDPTDPPAEVTQFLRRLERVLAGAPEGVWMYVASGSPYLMVKGENGLHVQTDHDAIDRDGVIAPIRGRLNMDGGDW